jgi:hypothetical protein
VHAFEEVVPILARAGARVIIPYTCGFGPTRFTSARVMRNGQQAARGLDIIQLAEVLGLDRPILGASARGPLRQCVGSQQIQRALRRLRVLTQGLRCGTHGANESRSIAKPAGFDGDGS